MSADPYRYFRVEARELLEQLGKGVLELEKGAPAPELAPQLLRFAHTLKGAARVVKQREIAELAHAMEDLLGPLRECAGPVPGERISEALRLIDAIGDRVNDLQPPAEGATAESRGAPEEIFRTVRTDIAEMGLLLDGISETGTHIGSMRRTIGVVERARHLANLLGEQLASPRPAGAHRAGGVSGKARSLAEELRTVVAEMERSLTGGVDQAERELRQVRDAAERLRLLPASVLFGSLERTARDAAQAVGTRASFEARGGDVRLDAHVLGTLQGALIQVVRNAVAHGIEAEPERLASGKPPVGRVILEVLRRGRRVVFQCHDDGRGVDIEAVRRVAEKKGRLSPEAEKLGVQELLQLLLRGGLTTSAAVTEVYGRGIGLDVVREAAARLGGDVAVRTEAGRGTTLELVVPVSLSSLDALLVQVSGHEAAIPLEAVRRTLRARADEISVTARGAAILHEGRAVPFVPLSRSLRLGDPSAPGSRPWSVVVVDGGTGFVAVGVDRLLGTANLVLQPLPALSPADLVVAGVSLDGEGNPQVVVEPEKLLASALGDGESLQAPEGAQAPSVLVVDDSLTTRMLEQSILESAGYAVDLAVSGEEALEKARRQRYQLFIVDIEMPGMDGFTFAERARSDPLLRDIPTILVTSRSAPEDRRRGAEVGARAYIVKSEFDQAELLRAIQDLVG